MESEFYPRLFAALNDGLVMSLKLILPSALGGVLLGVLVGALRTYGNVVVRKAGDAYAALFRGTPLVIQLFTIYYALPHLNSIFTPVFAPLNVVINWLNGVMPWLHLPQLSLLFSPYAAAVTGFMLCSGAYQSEYVRGALLSIKNGQYLGAWALGLSNVQTIVSIIIPQAFRRALPGCGNEIIYLIKYSSLAYIVTCMELTGEGKSIAAEYYRYSQVFLVVGAYYLVLVTVAMLLLNRLKKALAIPGFGYERE